MSRLDEIKMRWKNQYVHYNDIDWLLFRVDGLVHAVELASKYEGLHWATKKVLDAELRKAQE